jgi:hypothetical protein
MLIEKPSGTAQSFFQLHYRQFSHPTAPDRFSATATDGPQSKPSALARSRALMLKSRLSRGGIGEKFLVRGR